jgi:hypothetical protein
MKSLTTLVAAGLVAGCSAGTGGLGIDTTGTPQDPPASPQAASPAAPPYETPVERRTTPVVQAGTIDTHLAQLRALQIFQVYGDIENRNCYAGPCIEDPTTAFEPKVPADVRVADFTARALAAAGTPASDCYVDLEGQVAQDNLAFLRSLQVAEIGDLVVAQPQNNPNCYNLPCAEDTQAAAEINRDRARRLASIAGAFRKGQ